MKTGRKEGGMESRRVGGIEKAGRSKGRRNKQEKRKKKKRRGDGAGRREKGR